MNSFYNIVKIARGQTSHDSNVNYEDFTERIRTNLIEEVKDKVHVYARLTENELR